jgi:hypothetical protein
MSPTLQAGIVLVAIFSVDGAVSRTQRGLTSIVAGGIDEATFLSL